MANIKRIFEFVNEDDRRVLRMKSKRIHHFGSYLERIALDMYATMRAHGGVGISAPQVGVPIRLIIAEDGPQSVILVNPEIVKWSKDFETDYEECLSLRGFKAGKISRARAVVVKGYTVQGRAVTVHAEGLFARIIQHEIDHLNGVLYIDRVQRAEESAETEASA